jgi:Radical SAM superfamily
MTQCVLISNGVFRNVSEFRHQRSLGVYRIASALQQSGYESIVIDCVEDFSEEEISQFFDKHICDDTIWVGISSTFFDDKFGESSRGTQFIEYLIEEIKRRSNCKIISGGHLSKRIQTNEDIDFFVVGNADTAVINLTRYIETSDSSFLPFVEERLNSRLKPQYTIRAEKYKEPELNETITNWLDPKFCISKGEALPLELARGCIFKCKFCSYPLLGKKKGTYTIDAEIIKDQLIQLYEVNGTTDYYIADNTFNDDNDKMEILHKMFTSLPFKPRFCSFLRLDLINRFPHQADMLLDMGLVSTFFGIESLNYESARAIGKGLHPNKVKDRLYWLKEKWAGKAVMTGGFILGLPYDTEKYFNELLRWCMEKDNPLDTFAFNALWLYSKKLENAVYSEFEINPEIYGYEFQEGPANNNWFLKSQNLTYEKCENSVNLIDSIVRTKNKINDFTVISALNSGIPLHDIATIPAIKLYQNYNLHQSSKRQESVSEYKKRLLSL